MEFTTTDLKALFRTFATRMAVERDALCALDGAIGDGDHGIAMEQGMAAATTAAEATVGRSAAQLVESRASQSFDDIGPEFWIASFIITPFFMRLRVAGRGCLLSPASYITHSTTVSADGERLLRVMRRKDG